MNAFVPSGLDVSTSIQIATLLHKHGFNCVRLNWSVELVQDNPIVNHDAIKAMRSHGVITSDFARALDVLDQVISDLTAMKVMIILDNHMSNAGWYFTLICKITEVN